VSDGLKQFCRYPYPVTEWLVIFDSGNAKAGAPITLIACGSQIRIEQPTRLRVDTDAAQLRVEKGAAAVTRDGKNTRVGADQVLG